MATPRMIIDDRQTRTGDWSDIDATGIGELFEEFQIQLSAALDNIRAADVEDAFQQFSVEAAPEVVSVPMAQVNAPEAFIPETAVPLTNTSEKIARATHVQRRPAVISLQAPKPFPWISAELQQQGVHQQRSEGCDDLECSG